MLMGPDRWVRRVFDESKRRYELGIDKSNWCSYTHMVMDLNEAWEKGFIENLNEWKATVRKKALKSAEKEWKSNMAIKSKLEKYASWKPNIDFEKYLAYKKHSYLPEKTFNDAASWMLPY